MVMEHNFKKPKKIVYGQTKSPFFYTYEKYYMYNFKDQKKRCM